MQYSWLAGVYLSRVLNIGRCRTPGAKTGVSITASSEFVWATLKSPLSSSEELMPAKLKELRLKEEPLKLLCND